MMNVSSAQEVLSNYVSSTDKTSTRPLLTTKSSRKSIQRWISCL